MSSIPTDRREFLKRSGVAGAAWAAAALLGPSGAARAGAAAATPPLVRKSIAQFVQDPSLLASFRRGVKKMRGLPATDPRSWVFQANIHWRPFFPVYVYQQATQSNNAAQQLFRDDTGFTPNPNVFSQCPHGNWWFLPWHRAYLYYFERILRFASGDKNLTLPYWNYSDANQRELPDVLRAPMVNGEDNPLYLPESATFTDDQNQPQVFLMRDGPLLRGQTQLTASITSLKALSIIPFTNAPPLPTTSAFGSAQACDQTCACGAGALESVPHNQIHTAVGGNLAQSGGSVRIGFMGDISTAARDPIFWLHHSNIDRLWASWVNLKQGRNNPVDSEWLQYPFVFFDVGDDGTPSPVTITPQQLLTTDQLGYTYDKLESLPETLVASAVALVPLTGQTLQPLAATPTPEPPAGQLHTEGVEPAGIALTTTLPKVVSLPLLRGVTPESLQALAATKPEERKGEVMLSLEGIEFHQPPGVDYEVYLNLPKQVKPTPDVLYYVGTLTFFGMQHHMGMQGHGAHKVPQFVKFAVPQELLKKLAENKEGSKDLKVTFIPQTGTEPVGKGAAIPPPKERQTVTIRQIRLLQVH